VLFPGTSDIERITWTNAPLSVLSFARDTADRTRQAAAGANWHQGPWTVKADLSRTTSTNSLFFSGPFMAASAASFSQDLSTRVPGSSTAGTDLRDPANLRYTGVGYRTRPFDGALRSAQADVEYRLAGSVVETVSAGLRDARRSAGNAPGLIFADAALAGIPAASLPGASGPTPITDFFPGSGVSSVTGYLVGNLAGARDAQALRAAFGVTAPIPAAANPLSLWNIGETTRAAYLLATFKAGGLDGNAGLRMVRTRETVSGARTSPTPGAPVPIAIDSSYTDYLPSLNLRYGLSDGVYLRAAASKTITRPNFDQLSPSLTLVPNPLTPSLNAGSAGNPDLKPVRSDNFDLALERYVKAGTALTATAFFKRVDGFVSNASTTETYDGLAYQVTRPHNGAGARIKGAELGYQQFFDFLPGRLRGLGMQANITYVDSSTPNKALGAVALQNLSKNSTNLIAIYEEAQFSGRLAYNWRSKFLSGFSSVVGVGTLPVYTRGYGWLDGSLTYRLNRHAALAFEGNNLLRTVRSAYYGVETRPQSAWLNDRQFSVSLTARY
jgi:iron complex outermembrane receptor protein